MTADRPALIAQTLQAAFPDSRIAIVDDSHRHVGHAGAADGRGHFRARIISDAFAGVSRIQRHRMVFAPLADLMQSDIHALNIEALTPDEARAGSARKAKGVRQ